MDLFGYAFARGPAPAPKGALPAPETGIALIGLGMIDARILPQIFDELTVEEAREILGRMPSRSGNPSMMIDAQLAERPDTFAFKTREGVVGLLQIEATEKKARKLTVRYRLERRD